MEGFQQAFGHGLAVAARVGWKVFQAAILNVLFLMDEEHLEIAIEQDVDLLPLAMIYAPRGLQAARQLVGRMGRSYADKITLQNSLKWLKEQSERRRKRYYDIIVNLPQPGSNPGGPAPQVVGSNPTPTPEVFPPPGADMKRVEWFYSNVKRLTRFVFFGEIPDSSKRWGVEHLRWVAQQKKEGATSLEQLLEKGVETAEERRQNEH